jgi:hypothetical protein
MSGEIRYASWDGDQALFSVVETITLAFEQGG